MSEQVMTLDTPVPFGKYKGQPVAVMMGDRQYVDWCMMQSWFGEKYATLAAILQGRNTLEQDACTPEHNSLQMLFLKPEYQKALALTFWKHEPKQHATELKNKLAEQLLFAEQEFQEFYRPTQATITSARNKFFALPGKQAAHDAALAVKVAEIPAICHETASSYSCEIQFEHNNWDIAFCTINLNCGCGARVDYVNSYRTYIELKPSISEDYPSVLRKVKSRIGFLVRGEEIGHKVVITREITATTATIEEIKKMFEMSGVRLLLLSEIEARV